MNERKPAAAAPPAENYSERRRSHRVSISMPVLVRIDSGGKRLEEQVQTIAVSAHGCLLRLNSPVTRAQEILLVNPRTAEELPCTVSFVGQKESGGVEVGIEFAEPSPLFWRIAFPPEDWDPSERKRPNQPGQRPPNPPLPRR